MRTMTGQKNRVREGPSQRLGRDDTYRTFTPPIDDGCVLIVIVDDLDISRQIHLFPVLCWDDPAHVAGWSA